MANPTGPFGLKPVRHLNGANWNGQVLRAYISAAYASALFVGDPILYTPTLAEKDATAKHPTINVSAGTTGLLIKGVIVGFEPLRTDLSKQYNPTLTERWALITPPDPTIVYQVRDDGTGTPAAVFVGQNAECAAGAGGSTVTGLSSYVLDATTPTTTQAHPLHIIGLADIEDNELADYAIWEVTLNTVINATGLQLGITAA